MTKKIKNLTIQDIKRICRKHKDCIDCPLSSYGFLCLGLKNMDKDTLESEVEI